MSEILQTLRKKNDTSVEVYPNIKSDNIPADAITTAKILNGAVTYDKLEGNIQDVVTRFNTIYDAEDDEMSVASINVSDDVNTSNINASNKITTNDLEVTNDEIIVDGNPIKHLYKHIINCKLKDTNTNVTSVFAMNILSKESNAVTTFNDLLTLLKNEHCEYQLIMENGHDVPAYISSFDNDMINIYASNDGTITLHEYEYDTALLITDNVFLFN